MKKICKILVLPLLLFCSIITLAACTGGEKSEITLHTPFRTEYIVGEQLDTSGGVLDYTKDGQTTQVEITSSMITGFTTQTAGTRKLTITYKDEQTNVSYTLDVNYTVKFFKDGVYRSKELIENADGQGGSYYLHMLLENNKLYASFSTIKFPDVDYLRTQQAVELTPKNVNGAHQIEGDLEVTGKCILSELTLNGFNFKIIDTTGATFMNADLMLYYNVENKQIPHNGAYRSKELIANADGQGGSYYLYILLENDKLFVLYSTKVVPDVDQLRSQQAIDYSPKRVSGFWEILGNLSSKIYIISNSAADSFNFKLFNEVTGALIINVDLILT